MNIFQNYFLTLLAVAIFSHTHLSHCQNVEQGTIDNEQIVDNNLSEVTKTLTELLNNARRGKQGETNVIEDAVNYYANIATQISGTLDNLTFDKLIVEGSKRIPEETRMSLENALSSVPEPLSSFLKGPLEQINDFLQLGKPASTTTETPYFIEASTFDPEYFTVAPAYYPPTSSPGNYPPPPQYPPSPDNSPHDSEPDDLPKTTSPTFISSTFPTFLNRNRKTPAPVKDSNANSLASLMKYINDKPISNDFENVSNTITNTKPEPINNSVVNLFDNISSRFQTTEYPKSPPQLEGHSIEDDEDESLPAVSAIKLSSNSTYHVNNMNKFSALHKQLLTELRTLANATSRPPPAANYKTNINNAPENQGDASSNSQSNYNEQQFFNNNQVFSNTNGQQFSNNQGNSNYNNQLYSENQGLQNSNGQQFSNNQDAYNNQQYSDNQGFTNSNGQQFSNQVNSNNNQQFANNQGFGNSNGQQFPNSQGIVISNNGQQFPNSQGIVISNNGQQFSNSQGLVKVIGVQGIPNGISVNGQNHFAAGDSPPPSFNTPNIQIIAIAPEPEVKPVTTKRPVVVVTERVANTATEDEDEGEDEDSA